MSWPLVLKNFFQIESRAHAVLLVLQRRMEPNSLFWLQWRLCGTTSKRLVTSVSVSVLFFTQKNQVKQTSFPFGREVFYATEPVLLIPKLYCNIANCVLRVIDNDTYKEVPKIFNKVSPFKYIKNRVNFCSSSKRSNAFVSDDFIFRKAILFWLSVV